MSTIQNVKESIQDQIIQNVKESIHEAKSQHVNGPIYDQLSTLTDPYTRWFKYDRDWLCVNKSQFVPVIFEPPCMIKQLSMLTDPYMIKQLSMLKDPYMIKQFKKERI
jgi:hypothetical protein